MQLNLEQIIEKIGLLGIWAIIFAESGLLVGFVLPGDSLLFTAGLLAFKGFFNIGVLTFGCFVCAVLGDNVGYATGYRFGRKLFDKEESMFFKKKHLVETENFYEKHGPKAIILARFVPIIRTFAPIIAGVAAMRYRTFMTYNLVGGFLWAVGVTLLGYYLGSMIPDPDKYILPTVFVIILVSFFPVILHFVQAKLAQDKKQE
ncbi:MAG: hypothetical protein RLZZ338_4196 [Cyanobacteriota bacterium]|jgi:membrane-associated protein